jgi:hypothetical protein
MKMRQMADFKSFINQTKLTLRVATLGESCAGRSSVARQFVFGMVDENENDPTISNTFQTQRFFFLLFFLCF